VVLTGSQAVAELDARTGQLLRTFLTEPVPGTREDGTPIEEHQAQGASSHTTCFACHGGAGRARPAVVGSRPYGLALTEGGDALLVNNTRSGTLARIELSSGQLASLTSLPPSGAAHEPTGLALLDGDVFVSLLPTLPSHEPAVVRRVGLADGEARSEVQTGSNAGALRADEARGEVYVSNFESNTLTRLGRDGQVLGTLTVGNGPLGSALAPDGTLYVANYYDNSLSRVDVDAEEVHTVPFTFQGQVRPNPTHLVLHGDTLWALSSGTSGHLVALDAHSLSARQSFPMEGLPFDLVVIPPPRTP
jgi:sugar lactone lactonase YvrE